MTLLSLSLSLNFELFENLKETEKCAITRKAEDRPSESCKSFDELSFADLFQTVSDYLFRLLKDVEILQKLTENVSKKTFSTKTLLNS